MIGLLTRLFARGEPVLSEATPRDAARSPSCTPLRSIAAGARTRSSACCIERNVLAHRAAVNGRLVGFILSRIAAGEAEILSVAVAASWRGKGLARRLLDLHMRRLAGLGARSMFLEVGRRQRGRALRLYRRAGFGEVGRREGYYRDADGKRATALVLRRDLA